MTTDGIALEIVAAAPRAVTAGDAHLLTIDVKHDGTRWPYAREEHLLHCMAGTSPGLHVEPMGPESLVLHRFGGTYGGVTYKLTADGTQPSGRLVIKLLNRAGITLGTARLPIEVDLPAVPEPAAGIAGDFRYRGRAAALIIGAAEYQHLPPTSAADTRIVVESFSRWALEHGGVAVTELMRLFPGEATNAHIEARVRSLLTNQRVDRLYVIFRGAGLHLNGDVLLLPEDTRLPAGENLLRFSSLLQLLAPVAAELIAILDLDVTHVSSLRLPALPLARPLDGRDVTARGYTLIAESPTSGETRAAARGMDLPGVVLDALHGRRAGGEVVTWDDLVRQARAVAVVTAYASTGNPVLVSLEPDEPAVTDADAGDHEPAVDPLPPFSGHYVYVVTEAEYVPSARDELARLLGQRLARSGVGMVLGSGTRLDSICAEAYVDVLGGDPDARVVSFIEELPDQSEPWIQMVTLGRERRQRTCSLVAMAVILFGEGSDASAASAAASALGRRVLTLPDPEASSAAAIASAIERVANELEDLVLTHQWPRPALARRLAWGELSSRLLRNGLIRIKSDPEFDDGAPIVQHLQESVPLGSDRDAIPSETVSWAADGRDVPELALAMELLVGLRHARAFTELTRVRDRDALTAAAELAEMYIQDPDGRGFLYSWRTATPPQRTQSAPLFVDGLPVIGRTMLWDYLWDLADGDIQTLLVTGDKQSGKTFTVRLVRELVRSLGPQHRLISLRLTDARLSSFVALLDPYLGPDRTDSDDSNAYVRIQRRIRDFVAATPGVITWFAIDVAGQGTDVELSYLFPGLLAQASSPDVRLILIDTDFTPRGDERAVDVRLTPPDRNDVAAWLSAAYPLLDPTTRDEIAALADDGWQPLLDRIAALEENLGNEAEAPSDVQDMAQDAHGRRDALERLAHEYNMVEEARPSRGQRGQLDAIVELAIEQASAALVTAEEIRGLYNDLEWRPGARVVALACCLPLGERAPFEVIASSLSHAHSDHERETAVDTLSRLLDTGLWWQADDAIAALELHDDRFPAPRPDVRKILRQYRSNCGLPDTVTPEMLAAWWLPAGTSRLGRNRRMALFGSTTPETDELRRYWLRRLAEELGTRLAEAGWELVAGNGVGVGENAIASAIQAGGKATLLIGDGTEAATRVDLPPFASVVDVTPLALLEHAYCVIAIAGREGTDAGCDLALRDGVPVLLTDTRTAGWPAAAQARALLIERGVPEPLLGVLDDAPTDAAEYARRVVRLANCVRLAILRGERQSFIDFLGSLPDAELADLCQELGYATDLRIEALLDACDRDERRTDLLTALIARYAGQPDFERFTTALGYRTV